MAQPPRKPRASVAPASKRKTVANWPEIREMFVQGIPEGDSRRWPSLQELAKTYKLSYNTIASHSSKEHWGDQKAKYQSDIEIAKQQARITDIVKKNQDLDDNALRMANLGSAIITRRLAEIAEDQHRHSIARKEAFEEVEQGGMLDTSVMLPSIDAREIDSLSRAGMAFITLGQKALGTEVNKVQISGNGESPLQVNHSVHAELQRDDPERLAAFLQVLNRSVGIDSILQIDPPQDTIIDGEIIE